MTTVVEWHQPPAPLVKTLNVVLRRVLPSPLGRGVRAPERHHLALAIAERRRDEGQVKFDPRLCAKLAAYG